MTIVHPAAASFTLQQLSQAHAQTDKLYYEFLRRDTLSVGIYRLPAGGTDPQSPHLEDEVYVVLSGRAKIQVEEEEIQVEAGSLVFVAAHAAHKFFDIEEDLEILVFFAPPETH